ncbi:MAG: hypothetical protein F6K40_17795 [Okeania sp. SIO3I5]|uniref:hypothetical protein n=1 Tax=Okeania sp. SIO3I5 TaxID=2607805 RepID=UPI0013B5C322|nr:hypothetical protein [Okeania sp. SIO3I5]NEQ38017.1 hypothetical protein [Okeania sp. SIO3I5]
MEVLSQAKLNESQKERWLNMIEQSTTCKHSVITIQHLAFERIKQQLRLADDLFINNF